MSKRHLIDWNNGQLRTVVAGGSFEVFIFIFYFLHVKSSAFTPQTRCMSLILFKFTVIVCQLSFTGPPVY